MINPIYLSFCYSDIENTHLGSVYAPQNYPAAAPSYAPPAQCPQNLLVGCVPTVGIYSNYYRNEQNLFVSLKQNSMSSIFPRPGSICTVPATATTTRVSYVK